MQEAHVPVKPRPVESCCVQLESWQPFSAAFAAERHHEGHKSSGYSAGLQAPSEAAKKNLEIPRSALVS